MEPVFHLWCCEYQDRILSLLYLIFFAGILHVKRAKGSFSVRKVAEKRRFSHNLSLNLRRITKKSSHLMTGFQFLGFCRGDWIRTSGHTPPRRVL